MRAGKVAAARARAGRDRVRPRRPADPPGPGRRWSCVSGNEARLLSGVMTARVPPRARGFTSIRRRARSSTSAPSSACRSTTGGRRRSASSRGRSWPSPLAGGARRSRVTLHEDQAARIDGRTVDLEPREPGRRRATTSARSCRRRSSRPRDGSLDFARAGRGHAPRRRGPGHRPDRIGSPAPAAPCPSATRTSGSTPTAACSS